MTKIRRTWLQQKLFDEGYLSFYFNRTAWRFPFTRKFVRRSARLDARGRYL